MFEATIDIFEEGISIKSPDSNVERIFGKDGMITTCVHAGNQVI